MILPLEKLLPCPFCGGQATLHDRSHWASPPFTVFCQHCSFDIWPYDTAEKAIAAWNTRPVPAGLVEKLEAAKEGQSLYSQHYNDGLNKAIALVKASQPAPVSVSHERIAEKVRGAASDCNVRLEYDQTRYIAKAVLEAAGVVYVE